MYPANIVRASICGLALPSAGAPGHKHSNTRLKEWMCSDCFGAEWVPCNTHSRCAWLIMGIAACVHTELQRACTVNLSIDARNPLGFSPTVFQTNPRTYNTKERFTYALQKDGWCVHAGNTRPGCSHASAAVSPGSLRAYNRVMFN